MSKIDINLKKIDIKSLYLAEIEVLFLELGLQKYRAKQVYSWIHKGVNSFFDMSNLSMELRKKLDDICFIAKASIVKKQLSALDGTVKYLFSLHDGQLIESVLMQYHHGYSICISTQVGCKMGCTFCATSKLGFYRNLLASEMLAQLEAVRADLNIRISNIVLMGMGEPLDNFLNVLRFLALVSEPLGMGIGMRHISVSTCGIVDRIYDLAEKKLQLTLSVSLHAPNDVIRNQTMPINKKWDLASLMKACRFYITKTNRRISFEYAMIKGVNDTDACAEELAKLLSGMLAHVNLIPVNTVKDSEYIKSAVSRQNKFKMMLEHFGINATIRRTLGADIEASCGQLKRQYVEGEQRFEDFM